MTEQAESRTESAPRFAVRFSVIVPTYERPAHITACVAALRRIERPGGTIEIVIVNDGGSALPTGISDDSDGCEVRVVEQANAGPAAARNTGAMMARGECLAFTDDDCRPEPGWLGAFDAALRAQPDALAGGRTLNAIDSPYAETSQLLADFVTSYFDGGAGGRFFTSNNLAVSREQFLAAGSFDTSFPFAAGEDRELCDRWSAQGRPSVRVESAVVRHVHALSARRFVRQHFTYGRGGAAFRRVRTAADRPVRIEPGFYARSLAHAWRGSPGVRGAQYVALTMLAHASYAAGLLWESRRLRRHSGV
ncbi:MAG TPA: glycosyltransferase [Gemmatimonadaceae bacterium]